MKLELQGITKTFGSLVANDHIDLVVEPGEIHALLGENGAGKSTLMNVLYGLYDPDDGQILVDDAPVTFAGPGDAMAAGIGMVHQHFMLVPVFTVAENVVLGHEPVRGGGLIDLPEARRRVKEISDRFGFHVDPDALHRGPARRRPAARRDHQGAVPQAKVLILDEPTAVLTPQETDELIAIMRQLKESGTSIVFITHKLREVRAVADRITVIRRGKVVGQRRADVHRRPSSPRSWSAARSTSASTSAPRRSPARRPSRSRDLTVIDEAGVRQLDDVSFDVRPRRDPRDRRRPGQRPDRAHRGRSSGCSTPVAGSVQLDGVELVGRVGQGRARRRASGSSPRTARPTASSPTSPSRRTSSSTCTGTSPSRAGVALQPAARAGERREADRRVRRPHRLDRRAREHPVRRQPAEGRAGARDVAAAAAAHRVAAHPRPRRRLDRVRAHADRRRSATTAPR